MIALGFGVAWAGYAAFMFGYCLFRDYNVTVPDLFKSVWPGKPASGATGTAKGVASGGTGAGRSLAA